VFAYSRAEKILKAMYVNAAEFAAQMPDASNTKRRNSVSISSFKKLYTK
jgi:hypothetical protein